MQWTVGILRHFRALSTPEQNLGLGVLSRPAPPPLTQTVRPHAVFLHYLIRKTAKLSIRLLACLQNISRLPQLLYSPGFYSGFRFAVALGLSACHNVSEYFGGVTLPAVFQPALPDIFSLGFFSVSHAV